MGLPPSPLRELVRKDRLLLARGAAHDSAGPQPEVLVSLAVDEDEEVRSAAQETLERLSDEYYAKLLAASSLTETVARYFLSPAHLRPALLPALLANPASPQDAIVTLAAKAGPDILPALLTNLALLKTPALVALKKNPAYLASQKAAAPPVLPATQEEKLAVARGAKPLPEAERLRVLVALASDASDEVRRAAEETLARLPEGNCAEQLVEPTLEEPVARYFLDPAHLRPSLLPLLLTNPAVPPEAVAYLAANAGPKVIPILLDNLDLLKTSALIALRDNQAYLTWQKEPQTEGVVLEVDLLEMLIAEAEAEAARLEQEGPAPVVEEEEVEGAPKKEGLSGKLAKMSVAQKVKLALLGNREERSILIRDGSRVVSRAVLSSPKLTDSEVEGFAALKNVDQEVLRNVSMNRKFMKSYTVMKTLANNPRLPIDIGLTLIPRLIQNDLLMLAKNRDVSDIIRKMADKLAKTRKQ